MEDLARRVYSQVVWMLTVGPKRKRTHMSLLAEEAIHATRTALKVAFSNMDVVQHLGWLRKWWRRLQARPLFNPLA